MSTMMVSSAAPSAVGALLASGALQCAFYGMKTFSSGISHSSSHVYLSAPQPLKDNNNKSASSSGRSWSFPPELREVVRMAGGFEGPRRYPLGANSSALLLDHSSLASLSSMSSTLVRHHSIMPHQSAAVTAEFKQKQHTAALAFPAEEELSKEAHLQQQLAETAKWFSKAKPRLKGLTRKYTLRMINRKIVPLIFRRATIGIPFVGFYYVNKAIVNDYRRAKAEEAAGQHDVAALYTGALAFDLIDWAAQVSIITGIAYAHWGYGFATAAANLALADKVTVCTAFIAGALALRGEHLIIKKELAQEEGSKSE